MHSNDDNNEFTFKIKMYKSNPDDAIGIASNIDICKHRWLKLQRRFIRNVSHCELIMLND